VGSYWQLDVLARVVGSSVQEQARWIGCSLERVDYKTGSTLCVRGEGEMHCKCNALAQHCWERGHWQWNLR
jgi:hypothetical protein